jgi:cyclic pyranopterin phosphate synthase
VCRILEGAGFSVVPPAILPDDAARIREAIIAAADGGRADLLVTVGGTGFSPRDVTPEATIAACERLVPGLPEAMRRGSAEITPRAFLSRAAAGIRGQTLVLNLPGSEKAAGENLLAVVTLLEHGLDMLQNPGDHAPPPHLPPPHAHGAAVGELAVPKAGEPVVSALGEPVVPWVGEHRAPKAGEPGETGASEPVEPPALSHLDAQGHARMVDVGMKGDTRREAVAEGTVTMKPETLDQIRHGTVPKGDVFALARFAAITGGKRAGELIPLCHPLPLDALEVEVEPRGLTQVRVQATVRTTWHTGVEMEALTAVTLGCLTIYDMCKAIDRGMVIGEIRLLKKTGGKSGSWAASM